MGNPLVAQAQSQTTAVTGIGIAESAVDLANGVKDGSWVEFGMGALGVGMEALSMVMDPIGTLAQYGASWLIEHVRPLKEALDWLAGDPPVIQSYSDTWANVAKEVGAVAGDLSNEGKNGTAGWSGPAGDAYRGQVGEQADAIAGAATLADGISTGVMVMGQVVAMVRETVRDLVAELVGKLISWVLEEACTLGFATPLVAAQATTAITNTITKVSDTVRKLIKTIGNVSPKIRKIVDKIGEIIEKLSKLGKKFARRADGTTPSGVKSPKVDGPDVHSPDAPNSPDAPDGPDSPDGPGGIPNKGDSPDASGKPLKDQADDPDAAGRDADSRPACGDPVDPATGEMFTVQTDFRLPGSLPFSFDRGHVSSYRAGRSFGTSWSSTVDQRIEVEGARAYYSAPDGAVLVYPLPPVGGSAEPVSGARWPLHRSAEDEFVIRRPDERTRLHFTRFRDEWPLVAVSDPNDNRVEFDRDSQGVVTDIRHTGGYHVRVVHEAGLVSRLEMLNPDGPDVVLKEYRYDQDRRLAEVVNSSDRPMRFSYDAAGRIVRWEDRNGEWYRYHYDGFGRVERTEGSGGFLTGSFAYESGTTSYTDALGHTTTYEFDERHRLVRQTDPAGNSVRFERDKVGRLLVRTDRLGHTVRLTYDDRGNLVMLTRADGTQVLSEYDEENRPVVVIEPDGAVWRNEYDERGNLVGVVDPLGAVTRYQRDERGHLVARIDALGNTLRTVTDAAGLLREIVEPDGAVRRYDRDLFGRIVAETDAMGATTRYEWTVEGRPLARIRPDGSTERAVYDGEGNEVRRIDALGNETRSETTHFDLPLAVVEPDGSRREITYDPLLRPIAITDSGGRRWTYEYDAVGNLVREQDFNGQVALRSYDAGGRLAESVDSAGNVVRFVRDALGNVVRRESAGLVTTFEYDPMGRLMRAVNADAELRYERDRRGRVLAETVNGATVRSAFDAVGRRTWRSTPTGAKSVWEYGASLSPVTLHTAGRTISFGYDPAGREVERLLDTGTILAQAWDTNGRLAAQTVSAVGGDDNHRARLVQQRRYSYRADGEVEAIEDRLAGTRRFDLDVLGRVTGVHGAAGAERYSYDRTGAVVEASWPGQETDAQGPRGYDGTQVRQAGNIRFRYDAKGRVVLRQRKRLSAKPDNWHFEWDADDRLTGVVTPDGSRWRYRYDPLGRRIAKQRLGLDGAVAEQVVFAWDGAQLAEQVHSSGRGTSWDWSPERLQPVTQVERVQAGGAPQRWVDEQFFSIVTDLIGTPTELVDTAGELVWRAHTTVWGRALARLGNRADTPLRMPGQYFDAETGLHYNINRYYDPETGRYQSMDPLGLVPGPDPHAYVHNPITAFDPAGLEEVCLDRWKQDGDDILDDIEGTHGSKVAEGVNYNYQRMDPNDPTNSASDVRSHNIPGIGQDPHKMADYLKQFEGNGHYVDSKTGARISYDPEKQVIIVENEYNIHGFRMSQEEWNKKVQNGRYGIP